MTQVWPLGWCEWPEGGPIRPDGLPGSCRMAISDADLIDLGKIRFRKTYCRPHFLRALERAREERLQHAAWDEKDQIAEQ